VSAPYRTPEAPRTIVIDRDLLVRSFKALMVVSSVPALPQDYWWPEIHALRSELMKVLGPNVSEVQS
jgi:hypothetical protein